MAQFSSADPRTSARGEWLFDQIVASVSLVVRDLGGGRDGEIGAHRYLSSPYVSVPIIVEALSERTRLAARGRRVVGAQDTTEINFSGRGAARRGLGADGKVGPGYKRAAEDKESIRWARGALNSATLVGHARQVIDVSDREGDVW